MSLSKPKAASAATFEAETDDTAATATAAVETVGAEKADVVGSTPVAVATPKTSALAVTAKAVASASVLKPLENALVVEFDSLPRITAAQGAFALKEGDVGLGPTITLQLLSYQYTWCASPGDTDADIEFVKYGDNAITAADGTNFAEHIASLKEQGFDKAKLQHRVTLVGELLTAGGKAGAADDVINQLVQIDLPDSGRKSFGSHMLQASFAVGKGRRSVEQVQNIKLSAVAVKDGNKAYTKVVTGFVE